MKSMWHYILVLLIIASAGCNKLVDVKGPATSVNKDNVYAKDVTATSVLNGIYTKMAQGAMLDGSSLPTFMTFWPALSADELNLIETAQARQPGIYYRNQLISTTDPTLWKNAYSIIYVANAAIENLQLSNTLTPAVKQKLLGEAYFIRALYHFYLCNLYGDVPLMITTDYKVNSLKPRDAVAVVYKQIAADLIAAQGYLPDHYVADDAKTASVERTVPIKYAATALLARVYLYEKKFADAAAEATNIISQTSLYGLESLDKVFLKNSQEAIFQLQPVSNIDNTEDARFFTVPPTGFNTEHPAYISNFLLNAITANDERKTKWMGKYTDNANNTYYYPAKYKALAGTVVTEYTMVLRLGEQYLIRAEARAMQNDLSGAVSDLNQIRRRAGLADIAGQNQSQLIDAVMQERQIELFCEWGHRWLDLKRTGTVNRVMGTPGGVCAAKGGTWNANWALYPVFEGDLNLNPNLTQNFGY